MAQKKAGGVKNAITYYGQAIALQPDLTIPYYNLRAALQSEENWEEAIICYQKALSTSPSEGETYHKLAQIQLHKISG